MLINEGNGKLIPLGSMRQVMRESLRAAYEYTNSNTVRLGINPDFKKDYDISVLATEMAILKEGPSAGITILVAMVSALIQKPVRNDIALTGEITLIGKILPVGGIQEKIVAAYESGIRKVYVPAGNKNQVENLPTELKRQIEIKFVDRVEEVLSEAILDYQITTDKEIEAKYAQSEPYLKLQQLEESLRVFIESKLKRISNNWWKKRIPPDVQLRAEERKKSSAALYPWNEKADLDLIHYVDFTDYLKIIQRKDNWKDVFAKHFKDINVLSSKLKELEPIKNSIAHFRPIPKNQATKLLMYSTEVLACILEP